LFAAGIGQADIEDGLIWKGTDKDLRARIESRAASIN
jgi:hypothetical protein